MTRVAGNWNVWREFDQLQNELNNLFTSRRGRGGFFTRSEFPPVNVWRDEHSVLLTAELPGLDPDELDVTVMADTVSRRGETSRANAAGTVR